MSLKLFSIPLLLVAAFTLVVRTSSSQSADKPVEQVRKNIQVLKGLPDSQLFLVMNFVSDSLGVHCDYCHVKGEKNPQTGEDTWRQLPAPRARLSFEFVEFAEPL